MHADQVEVACDDSLLQTIPADVPVHYVGAVPAKLTRLVGLGNLGLRSWFALRNAVSNYISSNQVDLIYFTTTVFSAIAHGPFWKKLSGAPFVVDLQDPWRNDYYLRLPMAQRPSKFWFDYAQKKYLEARSMPYADGIISVSDAYIETMRERYPRLRDAHAITVPFSAAADDFVLARKLPSKAIRDGLIRMLYIGRGGGDMKQALEALFGAVARILQVEPALAKRLRLNFIGTSYALYRGAQTILPVAEQFGVAQFVSETPDRMPYFEALRSLLDADMILIPGSDDATYTASKIFPYIFAARPLLAILHEQSSAARILSESKAGEVVTFSEAAIQRETVSETFAALMRLLNALPFEPQTDWTKLEPYSAQEMTRRCCDLFDRITEPRPPLVA